MPIFFQTLCYVYATYTFTTEALHLVTTEALHLVTTVKTPNTVLSLSCLVTINDML